MIEWPIYRNFSVFSQNSGYFDQNEKGVKKCPFPQSLRFCHNWWASGGVPGVRYAEKLSALFYLHWESLWPGVSGLTRAPLPGLSSMLWSPPSASWSPYVASVVCLLPTFSPLLALAWMGNIKFIAIINRITNAPQFRFWLDFNALFNQREMVFMIML